MRFATVRRVSTDVPLVADTVDTVWARAEAVPIDHVLWTTPDRRPRTIARLLYDDTTLYLHYTVEDHHSYASATKLNGPVWEDSCVEFFAIPQPEVQQQQYVNFEVNCVGTFHLGYGLNRTDRTLIDPGQAENIRVTSSVEGPTKQPHFADTCWWIAVALPFDTLSTFTGTTIAPTQGKQWRANLHRLRSRPEPLYAAWNPIETQNPDFHQPSAFGILRFEGSVQIS